jgi:hypothetical protein
VDVVSNVWSELLVTEDLGLELVQRAAWFQLLQNLPALVAKQQLDWDARDVLLAAKLSEAVSPTALEIPIERDFHEGINPAILDAPMDRFPNVSVLCFAGSADPAEQFDQFDTYALTLQVETVVRAGPFKDDQSDFDAMNEASKLVQRRCHRFTAAVVQAIGMDKTLGGLVLPIRRPPNVTESNIIRRKSESEQGGRASGSAWFLQGSRLIYTVSKHSN